MSDLIWLGLGLAFTLSCMALAHAYDVLSHRRDV